MSSNQPAFPDGSRGSVILVSSTSGYFGGTAVVSYVSSKHGVMGLLRASQKAATERNIRVNAVAPFFTPTHITSNFAKSWREAGLLENTPADVAWAIAQTAMESTWKGRCCLVTGKIMKEAEGPREKLIPEWFGGDVVELMTKGGKLFQELGGYPLPPPRVMFNVATNIEN
jgi:NAD(P)-dependent dehydrogenase (short-subunit alcohol dehydrogenase family)